MSRAHPFIHSVIRIHKKNIWLSEFAGIGIVILSTFLLALCAVVIVMQEIRITGQQERIESLKTEQIAIERQLHHVREKDEIASALQQFTRAQMSPHTLSDVVDLVVENSRTFGYDPLLLLAVIHVESVFDPKALGRYRSGALSGALGLMQLKFETAQEVAQDLGIVLTFPEDLLRPEINVPLGVAYLTRLIAQFNSLKLGVLAYNLGPGTVQQSLHNRHPLPVRYYRKVLRNYYALRELTDSPSR